MSWAFLDSAARTAASQPGNSVSTVRFSVGVVSGSSCIVISAPLPDRTTIKLVRRFFSSLALLGCLAANSQTLENAALQRATQELERVKKLVEAGAAPKVSL